MSPATPMREQRQTPGHGRLCYQDPCRLTTLRIAWDAEETLFATAACPSQRLDEVEPRVIE